jgi:hypothetical protein
MGMRAKAGVALDLDCRIMRALLTYNGERGFLL